MAAASSLEQSIGVRIAFLCICALLFGEVTAEGCAFTHTHHESRDTTVNWPHAEVRLSIQGRLALGETVKGLMNQCGIVTTHPCNHFQESNQTSRVPLSSS